MQMQCNITSVNDAQTEGKVSVTPKSWLPRDNRITYNNTSAAFAELAYGELFQDRPKNICNQPTDR